ncbi:hypothetical protein EDB89DRAFT_2156067 [Lactarius sanguifluus]|nr:hypothetical protein EDB89DRAFT_2156067 [Lactarius sanguifluus]
MRAFLPEIENSASKLAQIWKEGVIAADPSGQPVVSVVEWVSRTTLDIIGEVGFSFHLGTPDGLESPLHKQNGKLSSLGAPPRYDPTFKALRNYIPGLLLDLIQYMPTSRYRRFRKYSTFMRDVASGWWSTY